MTVAALFGCWMTALSALGQERRILAFLGTSSVMLNTDIRSRCNN